MTMADLYDVLKRYIDEKLDNMSTNIKSLFDNYRVKDVADNLEKIEDVGQYAQNIVDVSNIKSSVATVAQNIEDVSVVSDHMMNIDNVYQNIAYITHVSGNMVDVKTNAQNIDMMKSLRNYIQAVSKVDIYNTSLGSDGHLILGVGDASSYTVDAEGHLLVEVTQ